MPLIYDFIIKHIPSTKANPKEIRLLQLIWAEYRSRSNKKQARINIKRKLGSVSRWMIFRCYMRFESGYTSLFTKGVYLHAIQTLSNGEEVNASKIERFHYFRKTLLALFCL